MKETADKVISMLLSMFSFMQSIEFTPEITGLLNSKKVSDHHAVIPTMELEKTDTSLLPETITSPLLTAEWENELSRIAKGEADADGFMEKIEAMTKELVENADAQKAKPELFKQEKTVIGLCPRCQIGRAHV